MRACWQNCRRRPRPLPAWATTTAALGPAFHHGYKDTPPVRKLVRQSGIELLHNQSRILDVQGRNIALTGLGDCYALEAEPRQAFHSPIPSGAVRVVLSHNPDTKVMVESYPWDLMLCGHTHGGQIWLPLIGAPFAPVEDKRFIAGLYRWTIAGCTSPKALATCMACGSIARRKSAC